MTDLRDLAARKRAEAAALQRYQQQMLLEQVRLESEADALEREAAAAARDRAEAERDFRRARKYLGAGVGREVSA